MKEEITKNIKKIQEEEDRIQPSGKGYSFDKENDRVQKLSKEKKERKVTEARSQREQRLMLITGVLMAYFMVFTAFSTYSMVKIQRNTEVSTERNETIADLDENKPVLFAGSLNNLKVNVYKVEYQDEAYKINYSIVNESGKEVALGLTSAHVVREDDKNFQIGMQFNTMKEGTLAPGEAIQGFMTFYAANEESAEEKKGYYTTDKDGNVVFIEEPAEGEKTESKEEDKQEENAVVSKDKMDIKLIIPVINQDGSYSVITEINR